MGDFATESENSTDTSISRSLPLNSVDLSYTFKITMNQLSYVQSPGYENSCSTAAQNMII